MLTALKSYRYGWPKKAVKTKCPACGHSKSLSRYIDTQTGELLPEEYGRCDRESNCSYHLSPYNKGASGVSYADQMKQQDAIPKEWFKAAFSFKRTGSTKDGIAYTLRTMMDATPEQAERVATFVFEHTPQAPAPPEIIYTIPDTYFRASLAHYEKNQFARLMRVRFGPDEATRLLNQFQVGTSSRWPGATVFWYIDEQSRIRGGQIKLFDTNWHTVRKARPNGEKKSCTSWVHSALTYRFERANEPVPEWLTEYDQKAEKSPCLFGLPQLLTAPVDQPVAVCESPKTAIICSRYFPEFTWLAAGALSYLNAKRMEPLRGRKVMLFPDLNAYDDWYQRTEELSAKGFNVEVSDLLEDVATDEQRSQGLDLADFLLDQSATVSTMAEQLANPGVLLKPSESQLERDLVPIPLPDEVPLDWNAPSPNNAVPTFRQLTYYEWKETP